MEIKDFRVYDPITDGIDYRAYRRAFFAVLAINPQLAYAMHTGLLQRVAESEVEEGLTLEEFLSLEDGFFSRQPGFIAVLFMNGRFCRTYNEEECYNLDLDALGEQENAVPFLFTHSHALDQYVRELETFEAMERQGRI